MREGRRGQHRTGQLEAGRGGGGPYNVTKGGANLRKTGGPAESDPPEGERGLRTE